LYFVPARAQKMMRLLLALALVVVVAGNVGAHRRIARSLRAEGAHVSRSVVEPLKFDQKLLLCNAYPSKRPVAIAKNGHSVNFASERGLGFDECAYAPAGVLAKDKLDITIEDMGIQGTFEVGDLPDSDAVLLLVIQRRDEKSPLIAFQSFAFPMNTGNGEAHLAVIDASVGLAKTHLKVQDLHAATPKDTRSEELGFNRIYSLDPGSYSFAVLGEAEKSTKQEVQLEGHQDYVVIRTSKDGKDKLVAFPHEEIRRSGAACKGAALSVAALAALLFAY